MSDTNSQVRSTTAYSVCNITGDSFTTISGVVKFYQGCGSEAEAAVIDSLETCGGAAQHGIQMLQRYVCR